MELYGGYKGKKILIACSMIEDEIGAVFDQYGRDGSARPDNSDIEVWWQERGHHNDPDKLRAVIQAEIDRADEVGADIIMLGYGLCGQGAIGWNSHHAVIAIPRFDDCCNMMLCTGKRQRRNLLEAGNMYLTGGWSKDEGALLSMLKRAQERYGERKGLKAMKLMFASYSKVTVIDTGCYDLGRVDEYADKCAEILGLRKCNVPGTNRIMSKLITGEWDEDIIVKLPGTALNGEDFEFGGETMPGSEQLWNLGKNIY